MSSAAPGSLDETVWQQRAGNGAFWSSIAYNGNRACVTDQSGATVVFMPSPEGLRLVAEIELDDTCSATPALANRRAYIRTYEKLWCVDGE